jgi:hypothetical protein
MYICSYSASVHIFKNSPLRAYTATVSDLTVARSKLENNTGTVGCCAIFHNLIVRIRVARFFLEQHTKTV